MQCWNNRGGNSPIFDEKTNDGKRTVEKIQIQESEHEQGRDDRHTYKVPEEDSAREKNHQQENVLFSQKRWIGVNSFPVVDCEWSKKKDPEFCDISHCIKSAIRGRCEVHIVIV